MAVSRSKLNATWEGDFNYFSRALTDYTTRFAEVKKENLPPLPEGQSVEEEAKVFAATAAALVSKIDPVGQWRAGNLLAAAKKPGDPGIHAAALKEAQSFLKSDFTDEEARIAEYTARIKACEPLLAGNPDAEHVKKIGRFYYEKGRLVIAGLHMVRINQCIGETERAYTRTLQTAQKLADSNKEAPLLGELHELLVQLQMNLAEFYYLRQEFEESHQLARKAYHYAKTHQQTDMLKQNQAAFLKFAQQCYNDLVNFLGAQIQLLPRYKGTEQEAQDKNARLMRVLRDERLSADLSPAESRMLKECEARKRGEALPESKAAGLPKLTDNPAHFDVIQKAVHAGQANLPTFIEWAVRMISPAALDLESGNTQGEQLRAHHVQLGRQIVYAQVYVDVQVSYKKFTLNQLRQAYGLIRAMEIHHLLLWQRMFRLGVPLIAPVPAPAPVGEAKQQAPSLPDAPPAPTGLAKQPGQTSTRSDARVLTLAGPDPRSRGIWTDAGQASAGRGAAPTQDALQKTSRRQP